MYCPRSDGYRLAVIPSGMREASKCEMAWRTSRSSPVRYIEIRAWMRVSPMYWSCDCRLVPDMTIDEAKRKLRAHLDKRGFTDIEVNVTGGYDPTETDENSKLVQAQIATYKGLGIVTSINPRMAGSWPGVRFTGPPLNLPAGGFGSGYGTGAHAPDEFFLIDSSDPKIAGMDQAALSFVRLLYQIAE